MRSFKSYVKSNPNDAVPILRSLPEVAAFVTDLTAEVSVLSKYLTESLSSTDEFFDVYKLLMEKQMILSHVRVVAITKFELSTEDENKSRVALQSKMISLQNTIEDALSENLSSLSYIMGKIPQKISSILHSVLQSLKYNTVAMLVLPMTSHRVYTAIISGICLSKGGTYKEYSISVSKREGNWVSFCSQSMPRFAHESTLDYKEFKTVKSGISYMKQLLSEEGILVSNKKFSLSPKEPVV